MRKVFFLMVMVAGVFATKVQAQAVIGSTLDCDITTLPYFEDFDGSPEESYPACWTKPNPFQGYPMTEGGYAHSGNYALKFKCNYTNVKPLYAVMPHINANFNDLQLTFWTRPEATWSNLFEVGYMTSSTDTSTFVALQTFTGATFGASYQQIVVSFDSVVTNPNDDYYIAFRYTDNGNTWYWFIDDIQVDLVASCIAPDNLSVGQVTGNSATLFWTGDSNFYTVFYKEDSDSTWMSVTSVTIDSSGYLLDYLTPNTNYQWYVAAECSDGSLANSTGISSFTTPCAIYPAPFTESFDSLSGLPDCWAHYNGLAGGVFADTVTLTPVTSSTNGWKFNNTNVFNANHASLNIYGMFCRYWLVTPEIDLSTLSNPTLTFDLALTDYDNSEPIENPSGQPDDKFMVIISTDGGATWSANNAIVWSNESTADHSFNQIAAQGEEISISLADYANMTVRIAFYGESTSAPGDNDLHIDNVVVDEAPTCVKPTQLTITNVTASAADLSWTENGASSSWIVEYGETGFTLGDGDTLIVTGNPLAHITSLQGSTAYDVYVTANCGNEGYSIPTTTTFTTAMAATELPYSTDFGETSDQDWLLHNGNCQNQWTMGTVSGTGSALFVTNNGTTPGYHVESTAVVCAEKMFTVGSDTAFNISFDVRIGGEEEWDYLKVFFAPANAEFPASVSGNVAFADENYSTNALDFSPYLSLTEQENFPFTFCLTNNNTIHIDAVMPNPNPGATASSEAKLVFVWNNDNMMGTQPAAIISNVAVSVLTCPKPTSLTVSNITETTADLSWQVGGVETVWNLEYKTENESDWTVIPVYSNNFTLTGLTDSTTYLVRVQADCGNDDVSTYTSLTFTTDSASAPVITDPTVATGTVSNITQASATVIGIITNPDNVAITERGFELTTVSSGNQYTFTVAGSGNTFSSDLTNLAPETDYAYRAFITFNGQTVFGGEMMFTTLPDDTPEPCEAPTNLGQIIYTKEVGGIHVTWTDNAGVSQWNLQYRPLNGDWTTVVVTGLPEYNITGLVNGEDYEVRVQAVCDGNVVSEWSATLTATASNSGLDSWLTGSVNLYPNPAKEVVNVQCTMNNVQLDRELHLFDAYGKLLQIVPITSETTPINVSGLANGMYFVRVTTEEGMVTKRFVKR